MKKLFIVLATLPLLVSAFGPARAADFAGFEDIDAIMEDNSFTDAANKYGAVMINFYPEQATLMGYESTNGRLDQRTDEDNARTLRALNVVLEALKGVKRDDLSVVRQTDYDLLKARLEMQVRAIERKQINYDPMAYTQAFNSIYDLLLKKMTYPDVQNKDIYTRMVALKDTAKQAEQNLATPPTFISQLATEQAYYAYLAFDEVGTYLLKNVQDEVSQEQVVSGTTAAKKNIREMFELFKKLGQENNTQDFRLGDDDYLFTLQNQYFVDKKLKPLKKYLAAQLQEAQKGLAKTLEPFALEAAETVTVDENGEPVEQPTQPKSKKKKGEVPPPTAQDFYLAAERFKNAPAEETLIKTIATDANNLAKFFASDDTLPSVDAKFVVRPMPGYYAYFNQFMFVPPYGTQTNPSYDFYLTLPTGNTEAKQKILARDYNEPARKLIIAGQLVPGLYFKSLNQRSLTPFRKMYPTQSFSHGWQVYAQHLAKERGYIVLDEELLFLAWADYKRAVAAWVDYQLNIKELAYNSALEQLTHLYGFNEEEAKDMLKGIAVNPGQAVSYLTSYDAIKTLRAKYEKKLGKKFSLSEFHGLLLGIGDIPPTRLEVEMDAAYTREQNVIKHALTTPFYF